MVLFWKMQSLHPLYEIAVPPRLKVLSSINVLLARPGIPEGVSGPLMRDPLLPSLVLSPLKVEFRMVLLWD